MNYLDVKKHWLEHYYQCTTKLEKSLLDDDYEQSAQLFEQREEVIQKINELDRQAASEQVEMARDTLRSLYYSLVLKEAEVKTLIKEKKEALFQEIKRIELSKKTNKAYKNSGYSGEGMFFDKTIKPK